MKLAGSFVGLVQDRREFMNEEGLAEYLLAGLVGGFSLFVLIALSSANGITEAEETSLYVLGWTVAPLSACAAFPLIRWLRSKFHPASPNPVQLLLAANSILMGAVLTILNLTWQNTHSLAHLTNLTGLGLAVVLLVNLAVIFALKIHPIQCGKTLLWGITLAGSLSLANFIGLFPYFNGAYFTPFKTLLLAGVSGILIAGLVSFISALNWPRTRRAVPIVFDALIIFGIALACFDPAFGIDPHHQNFYLGPANRILNGGTMLVDTFSQYGNLSVYVAALALDWTKIPFTYQGFSLFMAVLFTGQFILLYVLFIYLFKGRGIALILVLLSMLFGFFGTLGIIQAYPSTGPYRFGFIYILLGLIFLRSRFLIFKKFFLILEYCLIGIAFLWSFETFVYTAFPYLGICFLESFWNSSALRVSIPQFLKRCSYILFAVAGAAAGIAVFTYLRARSLPDWATYLDFIRSYSSAGFGTLLIEAWSPWIFPVVVYFASLMIFLFRLLYRPKRPLSGQEKIIWGLTLFGVVQYTYFLGRSHPNNLFHISIPAIVVGGFWLIETCRRLDLPKILRGAGRVYFYASAVFIILAAGPAFLSKYQAGHTGLSILNHLNPDVLNIQHIRTWISAEKTLLISGSEDPQVAEACQLVKKYFSPQSDLPIFLSFKGTTEVLFLARRDHAFSTSELTQDALSPRNVSRILSAPLPLTNGDTLLVESDPAFYTDLIAYTLSVQILNKLCKEYDFKEVEISEHGVMVVRLIQHQEEPDPYCAGIAVLANQKQPLERNNSR